MPKEHLPLRVRTDGDRVVPLHPEQCEPHTEAPPGYLAWHSWADRMAKTHRQRQCSGCGLWAIWELKEKS